MAGSFSQQLEDLLNPLPKFVDPEDDDEDEATKARVVEKFDDEDDDYEEEGGLGRSSLRKNNATLLSDTDRRYVGKAVSRKQLLMEEAEESGEEEEGDDDDDDDDDDEAEDEEDVGDEIDVDDENEDGLSSPTQGSDTTFPQGVDFHKLTEGMDDLGVSGDDDDDDDSVEESEDSDQEDKDASEDADVEEEEETVRTFSKEKVDQEVEKGRAVQNQLVLWDQLLEGRIKMQKALMTANQLPQPQSLPVFKKRGGAELAAPLKNVHKALKALQRTLLELQDELLYQNTDTRAVALGDTDAAGEDEDINSDEEEEVVKVVREPKRKLEMAEYPDFMAKRFAAFQPYQNATLQKWHDKTRLSTGKSNKGFGAFDRNILTQVEQVLMDKERLLRRTQTRRSEYRILGKKEVSVLETVLTDGEDAQPQLKANTHLKDVDEDIFDDDDFYHQLLRELIERKTSAADPNDQVAMGRQWLAIQKLRSKIKKKVDTKASKGRKVRFHVHSKLVNFMAPVDHSTMNDEARSELYRGLFGRTSSIRE